MICATALGLVFAVGRRSENRLIYALSTVYVEFMRNIPLLVLLYIVYYGIPSLIRGFHLSPFLAGLVAMTLNAGAYEAEIIRGGLEGIKKQEVESALSLALTRMQVLRYITIPHALRLMWDALGNQFIGIILGSSIVSIITLNELTYEALEIGTRTARHFEVFVLLLAIYVILSVILSTVFRFIRVIFLPPRQLK
jgi:His/Glu/Gln/Arg/opine family amino acid ABC transporter permease subunit